MITAVAAGAILAMVADTMIPEAFERTHLYAGLLPPPGSSWPSPSAGPDE